MTAPAPFVFNPFDDATRRDPYALFARARREHPVFAHEGLPLFSVFRHGDVQGVLRDAATWSNVFPTPPGLEADDFPPSMLGSDPPGHTRLRGLVSQAFTPRRIRQLEPRIRAIARELVDAAIARGRVDFVEAVTYPLPVVVIAELIGVPVEDRERFKRWSDDLVAPLGSAFFGAIDPDRLTQFRRSRDALAAYFRDLIERRRAEPRDDLLSALVAAELEGSKLSFPELIAMLQLLLVAGNETTTNLIGNTVLELLAHPDQLARVRADRSLIPPAVEEVLRFASPVQMDPRLARCDVEIRGVAIPAGHIVLSWLGSANRDEEVFPDGERFDVGRPDNRHIAFGFGPHYCLGASLATLEGQIALETLLERTRSFHRPDDAPLPWHPSIVFRGVRELPLVLEPA